MNKGAKSGRKGHEFLRAQAGELVSTYGTIFASPNDPVCINPEADEEDRIHVYKSTAANHLISALTNFRDTGDFNDSVEVRNFTIRTEYKQLLAQGWIRARAIPHLEEKYKLGKTTIEAIVAPKKAEPTKT